MRFRLHGFRPGLGVLVAYAGALAQPPNDDPSILQAPLNGLDFFTVTRVDADGTILLGPSESVPPQFRDNLGSFFAEGFYLLVTNDSKSRRAPACFACRSPTSAAGSVFTLKAGPQAAARVHVNDSAMLVRPSPVTTAGSARCRMRSCSRPGLSMRTPTDARETAARTQSINNLKQIGLAMHNFDSANNQFPPAVIFGPDGKPWHSWRVLILPFLEHRIFTTPTTSASPGIRPRTRRSSTRCRPFTATRSTAMRKSRTRTTPRSSVRRRSSGPTGPSRPTRKNPPLGKGGMGFQNITDGTSNTVMISSVEPGRKIPWTKPEDIDVGPAFKGFGQPGGIAAPYTFHGRGGGKAAPFVFRRRSVRMIGASVNPRMLAALITCAGGEVIANDVLPQPNPGRQLAGQNAEDPPERRQGHRGDRVTRFSRGSRSILNLEIWKSYLWTSETDIRPPFPTDQTHQRTGIPIAYLLLGTEPPRGTPGNTTSVVRGQLSPRVSAPVSSAHQLADLRDDRFPALGDLPGQRPFPVRQEGLIGGPDQAGGRGCRRAVAWADEAQYLR